MGSHWMLHLLYGPCVSDLVPKAGNPLVDAAASCSKHRGHRGQRNTAGTEVVLGGSFKWLSALAFSRTPKPLKGAAYITIPCPVSPSQPLSVSFRCRVPVEDRQKLFELNARRVYQL